jgi:hypothetical protein
MSAVKGTLQTNQFTIVAVKGTLRTKILALRMFATNMRNDRSTNQARSDI